ncbi:MAG: ABC transporter ATP-binding protein [Candidatus Aenigmatarchaeota archaeon]
MDRPKPVIEVQDIKKVFNEGRENELTVLRDIDLSIYKGEIVTVMGPSGSGKTTLLDIIGCLMRPTSGILLIDGIDTKNLSDDELALIRREKIGFIFQNYNLINTLTAEENVSLAMRIAGKSKGEAKKKAQELLKMVGLDHRMSHRPSQMSGGEQQRVAIARSLANDPQIVLGDELTGNLDSKTSAKVMELVKDLNKKKGYTFVLVTHDPDLKKYTTRVVNIVDGEVKCEPKPCARK